MKTGIHPEYVESTVTCSCGNTFVTRATKPEIHVELCNECHPFFTGKQKLVDSGGRVERFQRRYGRTSFTSEEQRAARSQKKTEQPSAASESVEGPDLPAELTAESEVDDPDQA